MVAAQAPGSKAIWYAAFGYFACYVPYAALTKVVSGQLEAPWRSGVTLLPLSTLASLAGVVAFLGATGWWRLVPARRGWGGLALRLPRWQAVVSGLCASAIIATTTLAYTFEGTSIVVMMLFLRGGVLALAPLVDALLKRPIRARSWVGLALALVAVVGATWRNEDFRLSPAAALDIAVYLGAYAVRLSLMSRVAKSLTPDENRRFFVEEQFISVPALCLGLALAALALPGGVGASLRHGFSPGLALSLGLPLVLIGLCSQGTGIFGALVLLAPSENSYCVPVNRASSLLAGLVASVLLAVAADAPWLTANEVFGAVVIIATLGVLA